MRSIHESGIPVDAGNVSDYGLKPKAQTASAREILGEIGKALLQGDKAAARTIYFGQVIPHAGISNREVDRLSYRVGAIDEGDQYLANLPQEDSLPIQEPTVLLPIAGGSIDTPVRPATPLVVEKPKRPIRIVDPVKEKAIKIFERPEKPIEEYERDDVWVRKYKDGVTTTTSLRSFGRVTSTP